MEEFKENYQGEEIDTVEPNVPEQLQTLKEIVESGMNLSSSDQKENLLDLWNQIIKLAQMYIGTVKNLESQGGDENETGKLNELLNKQNEYHDELIANFSELKDKLSELGINGKSLEEIPTTRLQIMKWAALVFGKK